MTNKSCLGYFNKFSKDVTIIDKERTSNPKNIHFGFEMKRLFNENKKELFDDILSDIIISESLLNFTEFIKEKIISYESLKINETHIIIENGDNDEKSDSNNNNKHEVSDLKDKNINNNNNNKENNLQNANTKRNAITFEEDKFSSLFDMEKVSKLVKNSKINFNNSFPLRQKVNNTKLNSKENNSKTENPEKRIALK